jgi:hypothetical protein
MCGRCSRPSPLVPGRVLDAFGGTKISGAVHLISLLMLLEASAARWAAASESAGKVMPGTGYPDCLKIQLLSGLSHNSATSRAATTLIPPCELRVRCGRMAPTSPADPGNRRELALSPYAEQGLHPEHVVDSGCLP